MRCSCRNSFRWLRNEDGNYHRYKAALVVVFNGEPRAVAVTKLEPFAQILQAHPTGGSGRILLTESASLVADFDRQAGGVNPRNQAHLPAGGTSRHAMFHGVLHQRLDR